MVNILKKVSHRSYWFFGIVFFIFIMDIISKQLVLTNKVSTTNHLVDITLTQNTGTLFSLLHSASWSNILFITISFIALIVIFVAVYVKKEILLLIPLAFLTGGILGNLLDRLLYSAVVDWINFHFWPIFNIADSAIVCGVLLAIIFIIRQELFEKRKLVV